jgi:hypothetical protein
MGDEEERLRAAHAADCTAGPASVLGRARGSATMGAVHRRPVLLLAVAGLLLASCSGGDDEPAAGTVPATTAAGAAVAVRSFEPVVPLCDELPDPADSLDWSGVQRTDAPLPTQTGNALVQALSFPYVVDYWGGTGDREGWIVIGVSGGAVELQSVLDLYYPGARVLVMPLDWTPGELIALAAEVDAATADLALDAPSVVSVSRGVVRVQLGEITEERVAPLAPFAERRVCLDGEFA